MPFTPSSPVRLYASCKSKKPLDIERPVICTIPEVEAGRPEDLSSNSDLESSSKLTSLDSALNQEHRRSASDLLYQSSKGIDGPLSMQEALAMDTSIETFAPHGSSMQAAAIRTSALFGNVSDSEYSVENDMAPVIGRASSVRVSKPQIVENRPAQMSNTNGQQFGHSRSSSGLLLKMERDSDNPTDVLPTMHEESSQDQLAWTIRPVESEEVEDAQSLNFPHGSGEVPNSLPPRMGVGIRNENNSCLSHDPAFPTENVLRSLHPSIAESETTSITTTSEPKVVSTDSRDIAVSHTLTSPGKGLSRRVTIRPADLLTKNHHNHSAFRESIVTTPYPLGRPDEGNSMEVARTKLANPDERTPRMPKTTKRTSYPYSPGITDRFPSPERPERLFLVLRLHDHPAAHSTIEIEIRDRTTFDDEALFKQIKAVYQQQILNHQRRAFGLIRKIACVTVTGTSQPMNRHSPTFDNTNFLQHLHNPQLGRKRKTWLLWLRHHNKNDNVIPTSARPTSQVPHIRHIDNLTRLSTRARSAPHSRQSSAGTKTPKNHDKQESTTITNTDTDANVGRSTEKRLSNVSDASSFYFAYSPEIPKLPFLSARHDHTGVHDPSSLTSDAAVNTPSSSPGRSFFWPSIHSCTEPSTPHPVPLSLRNLHRHRHHPSDPESQSQSQSHLCPDQGLGYPTLTLHSTYRITALLLLFLLNILISLLIAATWIIFGVPGTRPGGDQVSTVRVGGKDVMVGSDWRVNAQGRVATGVVFGFMAFVSGVVLEAGVVWIGSRVW